MHWNLLFWKIFCNKLPFTPPEHENSLHPVEKLPSQSKPLSGVFNAGLLPQAEEPDDRYTY